jgi:hypothetical protein
MRVTGGDAEGVGRHPCECAPRALNPVELVWGRRRDLVNVCAVTLDGLRIPRGRGAGPASPPGTRVQLLAAHGLAFRAWLSVNSRAVPAEGRPCRGPSGTCCRVLSPPVGVRTAPRAERLIRAMVNARQQSYGTVPGR